MKAILTFSVIALICIGVMLPAVAEQSSYGKLNSKAVQLYSEGKYDEAVSTAEEALKLAEQTLQPDDKDLIVVLENLASIYDGAKRPDKAIATYERVLAMKEKDASGGATSKARTLFSLGIVELDQKNWTAAESYFKRSLELREKALGADHADTIAAIDRLAWVLQNQQKYVEALPLLERALAAREKGEPDSVDLGFTCHNLGIVSEKLNKKADAERYFKRALDIRRKHPGEKDADLIISLQTLANYYLMLERLKSAEPLYKELLPLEEKHLGKENIELLPTLRGYYEVVGWIQDDQKVFHGLNKKNVADTLNKRIKRLEALEPRKDEPKKANRPSY